MKKVILVFVFIILSLSVFSQYKLRIFVIPFYSIKIYKADTQGFPRLFITTLLNTSVYDVREKNLIQSILEIQVLSLFGDTSKACATELDKLISVEQIDLGTLSRIGTISILNNKIIDVILGKNLRVVDIRTDYLCKFPETDKALV